MDSEGQGWKDRALNHEDRIAELEADRDEWMAEADLNLRALISGQAELAKFKSRHTGGGCGMGAATGKKP